MDPYDKFIFQNWEEGRNDGMEGRRPRGKGEVRK